MREHLDSTRGRGLPARTAQLRVRYLWRERAQFLDILHAADAERDELRSELAKYREGASQDEP